MKLIKALALSLILTIFSFGVQPSYAVPTAPINVQTYGAKCDGVTDDTTAIQSALNAVPVAGTSVSVPAGTCKISSSLLVKSYTHLYGIGHASRLLWAGGNTQVVKNATFNNVITGVNAGTADTDIEIDHLRITTTGTVSGSGNVGIDFGNVIRAHLHHLLIENPGKAGILIEPGRDIEISDNVVTGGNATSVNNGISIDNSSNRIIIKGNSISAVYDSGIGVHNSSIDVTVTGNVVDTTTIGYGIDLAGCQKTTATANTIRSVANVGIFVHDQTSLNAGYVATEIAVSGNEIVSSGNHGIQVQDASLNTTYNVAVTGNVIRGATNDGIALLRGVHQVSVTGNVIDGGVIGIYLGQLNPNFPNGCTISGNTIANATTGMTLDALVTGNTIGPNQFIGNGTNLSILASQYATNNIALNAGTYGSIVAQQPAGNANFAIDNQGTGQTVANNATVTPLANSNNFSGLLIVQEATQFGEVAIFITGGAGWALVSQTGTHFSATSGTAGKINIFLSGNVLTVENKTGLSSEIRTMAFRTRNSQ